MFILASLSDRQKAEALSDFNRWVTGVALGHPPSDEECFRHYIQHCHATGVAPRHIFEVAASGATDGEQLELFPLTLRDDTDPHAFHGNPSERI